MFENGTKIISMLRYKENAANCLGIESNRPLLIRNMKCHYGKYIEHVSNDLFTRSEIGCKNHIILIYKVMQLCKSSLLAGIIVNISFFSYLLNNEVERETSQISIIL